MTHFLSGADSSLNLYRENSMGLKLTRGLDGVFSWTSTPTTWKQGAFGTIAYEGPSGAVSGLNLEVLDNDWKPSSEFFGMSKISITLSSTTFTTSLPVSSTARVNDEFYLRLAPLPDKWDGSVTGGPVVVGSHGNDGDDDGVGDDDDSP